MGDVKNQSDVGARSRQHSLAETITFCLLIVLVTLGLGALVAVIVAANPPKENPKSLAKMFEKLQERRENVNYMKAVTLSKSLPMGVSATRWSHLGLDEDARCIPLRDDLWYACGTAAVPDGVSPRSREKWQIVFVPEGKELLYFKMGSFELGDSRFVQAVKAP